MHRSLLLIAGATIFLCGPAFAAPEIADAELRQAVDELSASTMVGGEGWKTYDRRLHPKYSRWAMGEIYEGRSRFVESLEEWWNYGMRVAKHDVDLVAVETAGNLAFVRHKATTGSCFPRKSPPWRKTE
jgi:hypothetical protein